MSVDLAIQQKLIRVFSAAAVCGLSISFLIGEAVEREARLLSKWERDTRIFPESYLPIVPLAQAAVAISDQAWRDRLVALNTLDPPAALSAASLPDLSKTPLQLARPELPTDSLVLKAAAPKSGPPAPTEEAVPSGDVERLLSSVHRNTLHLARLGSGSNRGEVVSRPAPPKHVEAAPLPAVPHSLPQPRGVVVAGAAASHQAPEPWTVSGRIFTASDQKLEPGHIEVGLFSKIDPEGRPVGYPLVQQILPPGRWTFRLEMPARISRGYLFAELVPARGGRRLLAVPAVNPIERGVAHLADLSFFVEDQLSASASAPRPSKDSWILRGRVETMFSSKPAVIPQEDVVVRVRGRKESARTARDGSFALELPGLEGTLFLEFLKPGYHPTVLGVDAKSAEPVRVELASRSAVDQLAQRVGSTQLSSLGALLVKASGADARLGRGVSFQLGLKAEGPFYFDDDGVLQRGLKNTSSDGRALFFNVEPGVALLESTWAGEALVPVLLSSVEGGEFISKTLIPAGGILRGRVFNPVAEAGKLKPMAGARVRIEGTGEWVNTDSFGAFSLGPIRWARGEKIVLEMSAEGFAGHRYPVSPDSGSARWQNLFAFPSQYLARMARSVDVELDSYSGIIMGRAGRSQALRLDALADHSPSNNAKDFYFDAKGRIRGSHEMTDPRHGNFVIFNVPKGRSILQGNDAAGKLRYSEAAVINSASVTVQMD